MYSSWLSPEILAGYSSYLDSCSNPRQNLYCRAAYRASSNIKNILGQKKEEKNIEKSMLYLKLCP